jgi:S-formylglutathione hydrolase FrmB
MKRIRRWALVLGLAVVVVPSRGGQAQADNGNPRYAAGGEYERYPTPPPRPLSHLLHELVPYVDATFPTSGTRDQRAVVGTSLGGIGAL